MKKRTIVAPAIRTADFAKAEGKLAYWKQVLPQRTIHYTTKAGKRATLNFDEKYLADLCKSFEGKVLDQTPFLLANKDNEHTMDPERFRGEVTEMRLAKEGEPPGLYAKIEFPNEAAALSVLGNPKLGVSARIREGVETPDGTTVPRAMIHVLGTLDPQVTGMAPWMPAVDLSFDPTDKILDLSEATYEGVPVADSDETQLPDPASLTDEQIDAMTEDELDAFLAQYASDEELDEFLSELPEDEPDDEPESTEDSTEKELEPALSAKTQHDIELASQRASAAEQRADEALRQLADARWEKYASEQRSNGVPPYVLDLAKPVLNVPQEMVIDLSNADGSDESLNVGEIVRQLVEGYKGTVDLSRESGHSGTIGAEGDPDADALSQWEAEYGF